MVFDVFIMIYCVVIMVITFTNYECIKEQKEFTIEVAKKLQSNDSLSMEILKSLIELHK